MLNKITRTREKRRENFTELKEAFLMKYLNESFANIELSSLFALLTIMLKPQFKKVKCFEEFFFDTLHSIGSEP